MHLTHERNTATNTSQHCRNNTNNNSSITTTSSSTSSSDSGVVLIDNQYTNEHSIRHNDNNSSQRDSTITISGNANNIIHHNNSNSLDNETQNYNEQQQQKQQQQQNIVNTKCDNNKESLNLNIEHIINTTKAQQLQHEQETPQQANDRSCRVSETKVLKSDMGTNNDNRNNSINININNNSSSSRQNSRKCSPTVSIRSTTISIISIDENAIDSSVVDTDSELEADTEGVHGNYVVKKLGQQTTYAPNSPEIPNINKGLTVLTQTISPFGGSGDGSGGGVGGVGELIKTPGANASPQIGSIALTNSSDVTFGDKHFYEGPVTIQQFLIDNREKWKKSTEFVDGQDNPLYADEHQQQAHANGGFNSKTSPNGSEQQPYKFIYQRKAIIIAGSILTLIILIGLTIALTTMNTKTSTSKQLGDGDDSRKNIPIKSTIDRDNVGAGNVLRIVERDSWLAQPPSHPLVDLNLPVPHVIVLPTQTQDCTTQAACTFRVRFIQTFNIESLQNDDIIYNFLIGGDGNVYEGRGWNKEGAHLKGYNDDSISFAYIGTFKAQKPTAKQLNVTKLLLEEGERNGAIAKNYKLLSAHTLDPTLIVTSGQALYECFKDWPHWSQPAESADSKTRK